MICKKVVRSVNSFVTNSFENLCELEMSIKANDVEGYVECIVCLNVSRDEIPLGDQDCEVSFRKIYLSLDFEGYEIIPGSKFGEYVRKQKVDKRQLKTSHDKSEKSMKFFGRMGRKGEVAWFV